MRKLRAGHQGKGLTALCEKYCNKNQLAYEIGSFNGESSLIISKYVGTLHCIDPWVNWEGQPDEFKEVEKIFDELTKQSTNIIKHKTTSKEYAPKVEDKSIDFIYIDGDHSRKGIITDLYHWYPKLKDNGIIAGHDYFKSKSKYKQVDEVVDLVFGKPKKVFCDTSWAFKKSDADFNVLKKIYNEL